MWCTKCGRKAHRDDSMERRCNGCERLVRLCSCEEVPADLTTSEDCLGA